MVTMVTMVATSTGRPLQFPGVAGAAGVGRARFGGVAERRGGAEKARPRRRGWRGGGGQKGLAVGAGLGGMGRDAGPHAGGSGGGFRARRSRVRGAEDQRQADSK